VSALHSVHSPDSPRFHQIKQKERAKFLKDLEASCERLAKYTQPFAWSAVQVPITIHLFVCVHCQHKRSSNATSAGLR
jgi:predicted membrane chloride channel (bestrophin family)